MLISTTFLLVLTAAFSFGILAGYVVIAGILHLFARSRRNAEPPAVSTQYPVLSTQKN
ncbi:MAG: hypothetical protein M3P27_11725 [Acidobacteriota bacterium]|nr:hypothetical protein [Acidobacteriota bacterium]